MIGDTISNTDTLSGSQISFGLLPRYLPEREDASGD
jgi:hypothetical protein